MNVLFIHSDKLNYRAGEKTKFAAPLAPKEKSAKLKNCLVCFMSFAEEDDANPEGTAENLAKEIASVAQNLKEKNIVLYPYVHLLFGKKPSRPETARKIMEIAEQKLTKEKYKVVKSPFGYYKAFEIACKGHPLSELSREITAGEKSEEKEGPVKERKKGSAFSRFVLVDANGNNYEITKQNWRECEIWKNKGPVYERLKIFVRNELEGHQGEKEGKPKHTEYMRRLELVDYCPESDVGHMKYYPNGMLVRDLILDYQERLARDYGAFKIQNPLLYRSSVPAIAELMGEFKEKDYRLKEDNEELVLRFASDPGSFPYMQKVIFSHKQMPIKEYEEAICFRKEQKGELVGLRRVRNFLMTDLHAFCKDELQIKEEFEKLCTICRNLMDNVISEGRWVLGWEGTEEFYGKHRDWLLGIGQKMNVPAFFKLMKERSHYYSMKNEFQSIEADEANTQISTVQYDVINGERFGIKYVGEDNKEHPCLIIHCSTFGSIERTLCSILENAAIDEREGKKAVLPLWLSPTQVRIATVSENHLDFANKLADEIEANNIRVDIDDRVESIGRKIRDAEKDWAQHIVVIGDKEVNGAPLNVRIRKTNEQKEMSKETLMQEIKKRTEGMPFRPLAMSRLLSKRPIFVSSN